MKDSVKSTMNKDQASREKNLQGTFNPFIHGTNSMIFSRLAKTQMQIISPVQMLEQYKMAPPGGEITGGGLDSAPDKCKPCFGILNAEHGYNLDTIIRNYSLAHSSLPTKNQLIELIDEGIKLSPKSAFSYINILLIRIARAKANGVNVEKVIGKQLIDKFIAQAQATTQFFYILLFLGNNIHPDFAAIGKLKDEDRRDLLDSIHFHLSFEKIMQKIIDNKINIKEIYENPTPQGLDDVIRLLALPRKSTIPAHGRSRYEGKDKAVTLSLVNPFKVATLRKANYPKVFHDLRKADYTLYRLPQNLNGYAINDILEDLANNLLKAEFFREMDAGIFKIIKHMNKRVELLKEILAKDITEIIYSPSEMSFLKKPFPIVLMCQNNQKFKLMDSYKQEYRAIKPLTIGIDINLIATDTEEHRISVLKFLNEHKIHNVGVILFDQLRESKVSKIAPKSLNTSIFDVSDKSREKQSTQKTQSIQFNNSDKNKKTKNTKKTHVIQFNKSVKNKKSQNILKSRSTQLDMSGENKKSQSTQISHSVLSGVLKQNIGFGFIVSAATWLLMAKSALVVAASGIGAALTISIGGYLKLQYLKYAGGFYDSKSKINIIKVDSEKQALLAGCEASTWKGYLTSFTKSVTYRHPIAFAAGYTHSVNKSSVTDEIKRQASI